MHQADALGRIGLDGAVTVHALPAATGPVGIAAGQDDAAWYVAIASGHIGRIAVSGATAELPVPESARRPHAITAGEDGTKWFTGWTGNSVGSFTSGHWHVIDADRPRTTSPTDRPDPGQDDYRSSVRPPSSSRRARKRNQPMEDSTVDMALWIIAGLLALASGVGGATQILLTKQRYGALASSQQWVEDFGSDHINAIGTIKILCAIGLVVPPLVGVAVVLSPLAACGLMLVMAGAATTRFRRREWALMGGDVAYLAAFAFLAWGRFALAPFGAS